MWNRVADNDSKRHHATKGKHPLRNADGNESRPPKAVLHRALKAAGAAQLAVDDDEADGPVHHNRQSNEEQRARQQARLPHCIWLADDAGADDGIGHVHKGRLEPRLGPPQLGLGRVLLVALASIIPLSGHGYTRRLEVRQQRHAVRVVAGAGVVEVESIGRRKGRRCRGPAVGGVAEVEDARRQVELDSAGGPRRLDFGFEIGARRLEDAGDDAEVAAIAIALYLWLLR